MRILFLLPDFPYPASTGGRLKVFNVLKYLSNRHQCDILSFGNLSDVNEDSLNTILPNVRVLGIYPPLSGTFKWLAKVLWNIMRGLPPSFASFSKQEYSSAVTECIANGSYDLIHYDIVNMAQYLSFGSKIASIHSPNDATSLIYFRMADNTPWSVDKIRLLISAFLLRNFERETYPFFNKVHVVSKDDAAYFKNLDSGINVEAIPIALDDVFSENIFFQNKNSALVKTFRIVCTGNLGNSAIAKGVQDFITIALPLILKKLTNVRFVILGQNISDVLQEQLKSIPNIDFFTWVDDYRDFLANADIVLVPDSVGPPGAKTRTLQAMGLGLPVVGSETAFSGIPFVNREHGFLYKKMPECAELIITLLSNRKLCEEVSIKAHNLVMEEFSLNVVGPRYEKLYQEAIIKFNLEHHDRTNIKM